MRKEISVTFNDRGNELKFKIKEMSAIALEKWIIKAGLVLADSGLINLSGGGQSTPDEITSSAMKALAENGLAMLGKIDFSKAEPLYDELLRCCKYVNGNAEMECTPDLLEGVIEDVMTLFKLRLEVLKLNFAFFTAGVQFENPSMEQAVVRITKTKKGI